MEEGVTENSSSEAENAVISGKSIGVDKSSLLVLQVGG